MIRKHKIWIIMGIVLFLLLTALPVNTKGMEENAMWDITFEGRGEEPFFQSSVVMEIDLKNKSTKEDVTIFIDQQKWEGDWDYDKTIRITFREEGTYKIHLVHQNGYEETRQITIELNNPSKVKMDTKSYVEGTWTNQDIVLEAYGSKAISKILHYEYKMGNGEWKIMEDRRIRIKENFDDEIWIRAVSKAGRESDIKKIWCRCWKNIPEEPKINCDQKSENGWYGKEPKISFQVKAKEGAPTHIYAKLIELSSKQTQTYIDQIPKISQDGKYQLEVWTQDEAGNRSQKRKELYFIDTTRPEIKIEYVNKKNVHGVLKYQKAEIKVHDQNLKKNAVKIRTSGKQTKPWKMEGTYYKTEVVFEHDGCQDLFISAKDMAGNILEVKENEFKIDKTNPKIKIQGIQNGKSYKKPVIFLAKIKDENLNPEKTSIYLNGKIWRDSNISKDGFYTIEVRSEDFAGNQSYAKKRFTINQKGINIHFLQEELRGKYSSDKNLKPGFKIESLEPVQVTKLLVNGKNTAYEWKNDKVYVKDPILWNGKCSIRLSVKDANGEEATSDDITFLYDTKSPVIKIKGLDHKNENVYGEEIKISLENKEDHLTKVKLDGRNIKISKNVLYLRKLKPGMHVLILKAEDLAGNQTQKTIKIKVTKVIPAPIKKMMTNASKKDENLEDQKNNTVYFWVMTGAVFVLIVSVKIYKKRFKS